MQSALNNQGNRPGVTLIEIMTVVTIVGLLAAAAIPTYDTYTKRAHVAEAMNMVNPVKKMLAEQFAVTGEFPDAHERNQLGLGNIATEEVTEISFDNTGLINVVFREDGVIGPAFAGSGNTEVPKVIRFVPGATRSGVLRWSCHALGLEEALVPRNCTFATI